MDGGGFSSGDPNEDNKADEEDHLVDVQAGTGLETEGPMPAPPASVETPPIPAETDGKAVPPAPLDPEKNTFGSRRASAMTKAQCLDLLRATLESKDEVVRKKAVELGEQLLKFKTPEKNFLECYQRDEGLTKSPGFDPAELKGALAKMAGEYAVQELVIVVEKFKVTDLRELVQYACGKREDKWIAPWLPPTKEKSGTEYLYFQTAITLLYAATVVGWRGGFSLGDRQKWLHGPLKVSNNKWQFNRVYLALSVLMKGRVPDGFNFIVPRDGDKYADTKPVDHATYHTLPVVSCMREVLAEPPKGL